MREDWDNLGDIGVNKPHEDVLHSIEEHSGETIRVHVSRGGEYALSSDTLERLIVAVGSESLDIIDIEARNPGREDGKRMVAALIEAAEEFGYSLRARNVRQELDAWWRSLGFAPKRGEEHSADYIYRGHTSA